MTKYVVADVEGDGVSESYVESLPAARVVAQRRARQSDRPVVIRHEDTGKEIARYEPPRPTEPTEVKAVIAKLEGATERMKGLLQQKHAKRRPTRKT